jgi:hypothetical protein
VKRRSDTERAQKRGVFGWLRHGTGLGGVRGFLDRYLREGREVYQRVQAQAIDSCDLVLDGEAGTCSGQYSHRKLAMALTHTCIIYGRRRTRRARSPARCGGEAAVGHPSSKGRRKEIHLT